MGQCERDHTKCFDHSKHLPTRVIDVQSDPLKLLDPSPGDAPPYVALSHCWGQCRDFLTTRDNLASRKSGFSLAELPATFRDAVLTTKALGVKFLWIDSICILQGDKEDWEIEGSRMADVYSNATLCIGAANASDDSEGFLKLRKQEPCLVIDITLRGEENDEIGHHTTRLYVSQSALHESDKWEFPPLHGRAWCLQERYLSPRILFFNKSIMLWECIEDGWHEDNIGIPRPKLMLQDVMPDRDSMGSVSHRPWIKMVEHYSGRAISFSSDKLPAISALAARVAGQSNDHYLAGIWRSDLLRCLLWHRQVRRQFREHESNAPWQDDGLRKAEYLAPSWSWASILGAVHFVSATDELQVLPSVKVIKASVEVLGNNKFGQVDSGFLNLLSPLLSFWKEESSNAALSSMWMSNYLYCSDLDDFDVRIESALDYRNEELDECLLGIPLAYSESQDIDEKHGKYDEDVPTGLGTRSWVKICGILISEKKDGAGTYRRVGCFKISPIRLGDFLDTLRNVWIQESRVL